MHEIPLMPAGSNSFVLSIEEYTEGNMKGSVFGPSMPVPTSFNSLSSLIIMIDEILDIEFNQADQEIKPTPMSFKPNVEIEILFRQNQTWQGRVHFVEQKAVASFRSVLELIIILEMKFGSGYTKG